MHIMEYDRFVMTVFSYTEMEVNLGALYIYNLVSLIESTPTTFTLHLVI